MLEIQNLNKRFGDKVVADHINLTIENGKILAILGPSGCGKSTLLNMVAGLVAPDHGNILLQGKDITNIPTERRHVALMFQDYALLPHWNVWQNVAFGLKMQGLDKTKAKQQALLALADVGLESEANRHIGALSGGEQQRVALARALAVSPHALLLDEPFSSLDTGLRRRLRLQTQERIRHSQLPAILVTHDPVEALEMADDIALMHSGRIIQCDQPQALLKKPAQAWVARLLGAENVNEQRYIPQEAIQIEPTSPASSKVINVLLLPTHCRLEIDHPVYDRLVMYISEAEASLLSLSVGMSLPVVVDETKVVWF